MGPCAIKSSPARPETPSKANPQPQQQQIDNLDQNQPQPPSEPQYDLQSGSSSPDRPKGQRIKVGGKNDGVQIWRIRKGRIIPTEVRMSGWEMKFYVDEQGVVFGSNKNDVRGAQRKTYSGVFKDGRLDCTAYFADGMVVQYDGIVEGTIMKLKLTVLKDSKLLMVGDQAECTGTINYK